MRRVTIVLLAALLATPAFAQGPVVEGCGFIPGGCPGSSSSASPAIPICIIGAAAGVIAAAAVVSREKNRELTQREALTAMAFCGLGALVVRP